MNRTFVSGVALALAGALFPAPLVSQDITVKPGASSTESFVAEVSQELDQELGRIALPAHYFRGGLAQVRFQVDEQGQAENVTLYHRSGDRIVDRAALTAVARLDSIGALPAGYPDDQVIQANIIVAQSEGQLGKLKRQLAQREAARIAEAAHSQSAPVLALTIAANSPS
ncbi:energy transducer TonB [Altererythrobacter sp. BO-6]|uniref:energy transducer TonB family protein n=1 Tax=Altererythrobacter sp. BO-6 TaxID=2604537 RepID=UPI0013E130D6|nr:energy transducer TonB [Altererythrobacter sp. BO-6]QIG54020.1 energy transducer TonB [Altererythrobacter sp. BO-6]